MTARLLVPLIALVAAAPAAASVPGAEGRIAFTSGRDGNSELYSVWPDGSGVRRLTWTPNTEQSPAWSRDLFATRIAYESDESGRLRIHVMDWDGRNAHRVSPEGSDLDEDVHPTWSPDAAQIAFASTRGGGWHIWAMHADGSGLRRVTDGFGVEPSWASNGAWIAYAWGDAIWLVDADGTNARRLTASTGGAVAAPAVSPDSSEIVFSRFGTNGLPGELFVVDVFTGEERQLTTGGFANARPSWSPDGSEIVFQRAELGAWHLMVIGRDGSGLREVTPAADQDLTPSWGSSLTVPETEAPAAPEIVLHSPQDGQLLWQGQGVDAIYVCTSFTAAVVSCEGDVPLGASLDTSRPGTFSFTVTAVDHEGRTATVTASYTVVDVVDPTLEVRVPFDGAEYEVGEHVVVEFACSDAGELLLCDGSLPRGTRLPTDEVGTYEFFAYAVDAAHNVAEARVTYRVVDRTPPSIVVTSPAEDAKFTFGESVTPSFTCDDASGVAYCKAPAPVRTDAVGEHTFTVYAADRYGNEAIATRPYRVVWPFSGFFAPLSEDAVFRAGDSVPVKFSLGGDRGLDVVGSASWRSCGAGDVSPLGGRLSYSAGADRYLYLVETRPEWAGRCLQLVVSLRDGTTHSATVRFDG